MKKFSKSIGGVMPACRNPSGGGKKQSTYYTVTMRSDDNGTASNIDGADVTVGAGTTQASVFSGWNSAVWNISGDLDFGASLPTLKAAEQTPAPTVPAAE